MKKLLISILAFIFSPIINAINSAHEKIMELVIRLEQIEHRQMEANYFLGGKAKTEESDEQLGMIQALANMVQQLNHIGRKAAMPLILTAKGMIINVVQCKKLLFECSWDHQNTLQFWLMVDNIVADSFSFNLEKISMEPGFEKTGDKPVFDFARVFLKKHTSLNNGKQNISIIDHIAIQATRILITYLPQRDLTFHANIDVVCYQAIINAIKPFYDKENAPAAVEQAKEEQNTDNVEEQSNVFPLNNADRTDVAEQPGKEQ